MTSVRFNVEWLESPTSNVAKVWAIREAPAMHALVGELMFNGNEWLFIRINSDGEQIMDGLHYIPCDPDRERAFREEDGRIATAPTETARDVLRAELQGRRDAHRDDTRDLAVIGAKIEARKWWNGDDGIGFQTYADDDDES